MTRPLALPGTLAFLALAPGAVVLGVPWWLARWRMGPPLRVRPYTPAHPPPEAGGGPDP